ncbi:MAG: hypothetical protein LBR34_10130 [Prevotella sp.]|jgi:hypothetical protein|nr:hypothetical protein [Prevotella sp.]
MDQNASAAYRCPTVSGTGTATTGRIQVIPINGSGSYLYELYELNPEVTPASPIATTTGDETDGVFTSWASNLSYDELWVKVTDQVCLRSFVEKIKIYDLNNALWALIPNVNNKKSIKH